MKPRRAFDAAASREMAEAEYAQIEAEPDEFEPLPGNASASAPRGAVADSVLLLMAGCIGGAIAWTISHLAGWCA